MLSWALVFFLLPAGMTKIPNKGTEDYRDRVEQKFQDQVECLAYLKATFGLEENQVRTYADRDMRKGFYKCEKENK